MKLLLLLILRLGQEVTALFLPANLHLSWGTMLVPIQMRGYFSFWQKTPCPVGAVVHPTAYCEFHFIYRKRQMLALALPFS